jgi:hypothetical protein
MLTAIGFSFSIKHSWNAIKVFTALRIDITTAGFCQDRKR